MCVIIIFKENFEKISRIIKKEYEAFDVKKCNDFKDTITKYLENMLKYMIHEILVK